MDRKVVFLDIDGTLVDFDGRIPKSAGYAVRRARANGHLMVICSGRSVYQIYPELLEIGFDGIISAAGGCVSHRGEEIFHRYIGDEEGKALYRYIEDNRLVYLIQAQGGAVTNRRCAEALTDILDGLQMPEKNRRVLLGGLTVREDVWRHPGKEKVVYFDAPLSLERVCLDLSPDYTVVDMSLDGRMKNAGEICIAGINKASGMRIYLEHVGVAREDSIAFGDGANDVEMMEFAGTGVAMGNAGPRIQELSDYVTESVEADGICRAFERLGLL